MSLEDKIRRETDKKQEKVAVRRKRVRSDLVTQRCGADSALSGMSHTVQIFDMVKNCVEEIHDGETIHNRVDMGDKELDEFIESMSQEHFTSVSNFFETMPKIIHEVTVTNPNTKKKNKIVIEGLQSFFA